MRGIEKGKKRGRGRPPKQKPPTPQRSPHTDRLCSRLDELMQTRAFDCQVSPDARSILLQLRQAMKMGKPTRWKSISQMESEYKLTAGQVARWARKQATTGRVTTALRFGRPEIEWEDGDWFKKFQNAMKKGEKLRGRRCRGRSF